MDTDSLVSTTPKIDVNTYRRIRKAIGILGIALPFVLITFSMIPLFPTQVQPSISDYYYTNLRELFTGCLCAVGLFLIRYQGHRNPNFFKNDSKLTNIAGALAFGVALMPTSPPNCEAKIYSIIPYCDDRLGWLHYGFAAVFFLTIAIIAINVFTIGQIENSQLDKSILNENNIYKTCGALMLLFLILTPICAHYQCFTNSTLVFESLMLIAFGIAWLIKGRVLGDKGAIGEKIYREVN